MRRLLTGVLAASFVSSTFGEVLDDSRSPQQRYNVQFSWDHGGSVFEMSAEELNLMVGEIGDVEVRLDTSAYVGTNAQIFLRLPNQINGLNDSSGVRVEWVTRGTFSPGQTTPGNQALIFDGPIESPLMIEFFTYRMHVDARRVSGPFRIEPIYEIEPR